MWTASSPRSRNRPRACGLRTATTLVEVLAGLVLLGTVLASVTVARGRFLHQRAAADRQLAVTAALDQLVSEWTLGGTSFDRVPRSSSGPLPGVEGCRWRTTVRRGPDAAALDSLVVRIEVWGNDGDRAATAASPIVMLDLVVPDRPVSVVGDDEPGRR